MGRDEKHYIGSMLRDECAKFSAEKDPLVVDRAFAAALEGSAIDVATFYRQLKEHIATSPDFG